MTSTEKPPAHVGLDGEMTGNSGPEAHQLIQIGLSVGSETFQSDIGHAAGTYAYQEDALAVCGFTPDRIEAGPPAEEVDQQALAWLTQVFGDVRPRAVGFGVSYFDMPYVRRYLPRTWEHLHRQCLDLVAICQFLEDAGTSAGLDLGFRYWSQGARSAAVERLGKEEWHSAGFDAQVAFLCYGWLAEHLGSRLGGAAHDSLPDHPGSTRT